MIRIFKYGSKFRLTPRLDTDKIVNDIRNSVNEYIDKLSYKLHVHNGYFSEWKALLLSLINSKIAQTVNIFPSTTNMVVFKNKLKNIQDKYVIMPVDKANNNFGFICKRYYAEVLQYEIINNNTFELSTNTLVNIRNTCCNF